MAKATQKAAPASKGPSIWKVTGVALVAGAVGAWAVNNLDLSMKHKDPVDPVEARHAAADPAPAPQQTREDRQPIIINNVIPPAASAQAQQSPPVVNNIIPQSASPAPVVVQEGVVGGVPGYVYSNYGYPVAVVNPFGWGVNYGWNNYGYRGIVIREGPVGIRERWNNYGGFVRQGEPVRNVQPTRTKSR